MTERPEPSDDPPAATDEADEAQARAVSALLKRSLSRDVENAPDLLAGRPDLPSGPGPR